MEFKTLFLKRTREMAQLERNAVFEKMLIKSYNKKLFVMVLLSDLLILLVSFGTYNTTAELLMFALTYIILCYCFSKFIIEKMLKIKFLHRAKQMNLNISEDMTSLSEEQFIKLCSSATSEIFKENGLSEENAIFLHLDLKSPNNDVFNPNEIAIPDNVSDFGEFQISFYYKN